MEPWKLVLIPLISALIGWLTNMLAVRMIFRPRRPRFFLGFRLQGLVPRRRDEIAASIGHTVQTHLISHADVRRILGQSHVQAGIHSAVRERINAFIDKCLPEIHPMISMFLDGKIREKLESMLMREIETMLPAMAEQMIDSVEEDMNFQKIVEDKIRTFDLDQLERMILDIASRELKAIELLGGVLGFIIGFVQVGLVYL